MPKMIKVKINSKINSIPFKIMILLKTLKSMIGKMLHLEELKSLIKLKRK